MQPSLRALLTGLIDYAGLFPPAKLGMEEAARNYFRYRAGPEGWMLGRFICPAARLQEFSPFLRELAGPGPPVPLSVLGRGGQTTEEFYEGMTHDVRDLAEFHWSQRSLVRIEAFEVRLPEKALSTPEAEHPAALLTVTNSVLEKNAHGPITPYYELPPDPDWGETLRRALAAVAECGTLTATLGNVQCNPPGLKLRCGGQEATAFPTAEQVTAYVTGCRDKHVPLKATAGLHHPLRRFDPAVQTQAHGFINLFVAGVLAHARKLTEEQVRQIIETEDGGDFVFEEFGLRWRDQHANLAEIHSARERAVTSFGSCSFDEPREDLRALGWL